MFIANTGGIKCLLTNEGKWKMLKVDFYQELIFIKYNFLKRNSFFHLRPKNHALAKFFGNIGVL
jgi:hypothetical protein